MYTPAYRPNFTFFLRFYSTIFLLMSVSIASAQIRSEFGRELLQKRLEESKAVERDFTIDYQVSNICNDHVEFGLSIDPNTSSLAGRDDPQLLGVINRVGVNFQGTLPLSRRFWLKLQSNPQVENYIGEDGKLNEFDGFAVPFLTELNFQPTSKLPPLTTSYQLQRLSRKDSAFDSLQHQIGFRFGRVLEYNLRAQRFDDDQTRREDFLLVGATSHQGIGRLQVGFFKQLLGKLEYSIEREAYKDNLNSLVLGAAGIKPGESRTDVRHFGSVKLLEIATGRLVLQEELNIFLNRSNVEFYDFSSIEAAIGAFYKINSRSWARVRLSRLGIKFDGRQVRDESGFVAENADDRRDDQIGVSLQLNWQFRDNLTLFADYQLIKNDTNEESEIFDFLNYKNNIVSLAIQATY